MILFYVRFFWLSDLLMTLVSWLGWKKCWVLSVKWVLISVTLQFLVEVKKGDKKARSKNE